MRKAYKWTLPVFFVTIFFRACSQTKINDTAFDFSQRMQAALSSSTRDLLDKVLLEP